jgi:hypothetical protein
MNELTTVASPGETKTLLACRLRHRRGGRGSSPTAGEVEIENISSEAIEIEVTMHPLQYLDLRVTDADGKLVPAPPYGNIFSPRETSYFLRLAPGEKYTHNVSLLGNIPEERCFPGTYIVQAVYEYNGVRVVSEPLQVQLPARKS